MKPIIPGMVICNPPPPQPAPDSPQDSLCIGQVWMHNRRGGHPRYWIIFRLTPKAAQTLEFDTDGNLRGIGGPGRFLFSGRFSNPQLVGYVKNMPDLFKLDIEWKEDKQCS